MLQNAFIAHDAPVDSSHANCRVCGTTLHIPFADLGVSPIANDMVKPENIKHGETFYPLNAMVCDHCWLVQLTYSHPATEIFTDDYPYFSSYSESWLTHAAAYADLMIERLGLGVEHRVVEVASNDGYLLRFFKKRNIRVLGVEPCKNVATAARDQHGIPTIVQFFSQKVGAQLAAEHGHADLMVANNVLAHVPDMLDFLGGFAELLSEEGVATFEFPHLLELIRYNQFDTIYHEHYRYLSVLSLCYALARVGLRPFDVQRLPTHGGSLRLFACRENASHQRTAALTALEAEEKQAGLDHGEIYTAFQERVRRTKRSLLDFLIQVKNEGKRIVGYGAPAKGNTLLNYCGISTDFLDYTVDISPHKQGMFLPGSRLKVLHPDAIRKTKPDYVLILPWNLTDEIMRQNIYVTEWGGRFVIPIPEVKVL